MEEIKFEELNELLNIPTPSGFGCGDDCSGAVCGGNCPGGAWCGFSLCPHV